MVIEHPQQMSDVQFFMFFKAERLTDLWLGLNEIQQFQCTLFSGYLHLLLNGLLNASLKVGKFMYF